MSQRVEALLAALSLDEKATLTAGAALFATAGIPRLGIPAVNLTDGPNGARGPALFGLGSDTAVCVPCGSALGATFDPALVERVGVMLGEEARTKACRVLLAPTVNLHRSPIAGRNFECYSEDPLLAGKLAAAFVRGVQSRRVATTVKHFAGNEAEFERNTMSSLVDARALRELYLVPFELAVKEGKSLGIMTAYNRLNGTHCSEHPELVTGILREEWGFEGFVVTDWFSAGSTAGSAAAGIDLEMPGNGRFFGAALAAAVKAGDVAPEVLDAMVRRFLGVLDRLGALDDAGPEQIRSVDRADHRALAREAAAAAMVLLKNDGVLPFDRAAIRTIAVCGPNAERAQIMGGGSANLAPHYWISPLEAIRARVGDGVAVRYERGCAIEKTATPLRAPRVFTPEGEPGLAAEIFAGDAFEGAPVDRRVFRDGRLIVIEPVLAGAPGAAMSMRVRARFRADEDGEHAFTFVQIGGRARVTIDGAVVFDGIADPPPPGSELFGMGSQERRVAVALRAGHEVEIEAVFVGPKQMAFLRGIRIGCVLPEPTDLLERAVAAAAAADAAVVIVGTNDEWESEGEDRATMDLPGRQDELAARVVAANPNTVVVVNTGSPVTMDWADAARAVLQAWFGGQEMANALAGILFGDADPSGRLPVTIPLRLEHNPSFGNFPGENGEVRYGEGLFIGYRWYDSRSLPVRYPFGHGLSYAHFAIGAPAHARRFARGGALRVEVPVENRGARRGSEVVQCYVEPVGPRLVRPRRELKAFAKVTLDPGERATAVLVLDDRAFAYWDPADEHWARTAAQRSSGFVPAGPNALHREVPGWYVDAGTYRLHIGRSSADLPHCSEVVVEDGGIVP
jgi:beta-glucosidase